MIRLKIHSIVDIITNSSTVIYTYQNGCVNPAKELINEMLKLSGENALKAEDIFYFGVFCDTEKYMDNIPDDLEDCPKITASYGTEKYKEQSKVLDEWFENLQLSIMKGEIEQPEWMNEVENGGEWNPDTYLTLIPKNEKYSEFGNKICIMLSTISADGGRDE
jgi:hypothetical protein